MTQNFLKYFPVSSLGVKKIFRKKYRVTCFVFKKIDATDGKKWVEYFAMQQNSTTLIFLLNYNERCNGEFPWKKLQPFKTVQFQAWKITPSSVSLQKKTETILSHFKYSYIEYIKDC